jgi:uncharacterized protein YjbI with pentapeptide repeats
MTSRFVRTLATMVCAGLFAILPIAPVLAQPDPGSPGAATATQPRTGDVSVDCSETIDDRTLSAQELTNLQLCQQIAKLKLEVDALKEARGNIFSIFMPISAAVGAVVGIVLTIIGGRFQHLLNKANTDKAKLEEKKLDQERRIKREEHNIKLMEGMGAQHTAVQLASAASVLQRAAFVGASANPEDQREFAMLAQVLVAVLRARSLNDKVTKFVAEELVNVFMLRGRTSADGLPAAANLATYGLSNAELTDIDWQRVYAPGVDFFKAKLTKSTLRSATLTNAVFYEADLTGVVFKGADVTGANFTGAILDGANFTGAKGLETATFHESTRWNDKTLWPAGFSPPAGTVSAASPAS